MPDDGSATARRVSDDFDSDGFSLASTARQNSLHHDAGSMCDDVNDDRTDDTPQAGAEDRSARFVEFDSNIDDDDVARRPEDIDLSKGYVVPHRAQPGRGLCTSKKMDGRSYYITSYYPNIIALLLVAAYYVFLNMLLGQDIPWKSRTRVTASPKPQ